MSKRKRDEEKREIHIERRREAPPMRAGKVQEKMTENRTDARRRMYESKQATHTDTSDNLSTKRDSLSREVNSLVFRVNNLPSRVNQVDNSIKGISNRITAVKAGGYYLPKNLEEESEQLIEKWSQAAPEITGYSTQQSHSLLQKQNILESDIQRSNSLNDLNQNELNLSNLTQSLVLIEGALNSRLQDYQSQYSQLNKELLRAEETSKNLSNTSIQWKSNEYPIYATKIMDLTNNKEGILTLSNYRILFEEEKEEVIKKTLFFATEKRTIREVLLDQPIGSIDNIEKARVGLFKGAGLYIKFKPQTGLDEIKIDTRSDDDQDIIHFYNQIITGNIESETKTGTTSTVNVPTQCPNCSAPFTEDILKGQTSIKCNYCGSVIKL